MRKYISIFFILILTLFVASCSLQKRIRKADQRNERGEYFEAAKMYQRIYRRIPARDKALRASVAFKQGEAYRLINNPRAEMAFQNAVRNNSVDSLLYFRYAEVLLQNGKYTDATTNFQEFLKQNPDHQEAQNGLQAAQLAEQWKSEIPQFKITKSKDFNNKNRASNFSPAFTSAAADAVVFSSMRSEKNITKKAKTNAVNGLPLSKLYISKKNNKGKWEEPELLEETINSQHDDGVASFSSDGKTMYFTRAVQNSQSDAPTVILMSQRTGGEWAEPQQIIFFGDSSIAVAHPAIAPDDVTLYFVSDNPLGFGGKDIWKGKIEGTECKYIQNLGNQVNTAQDEMFPTVAPDGTLYFSSNGLAGIGGLDLFKATFHEDSATVVENLGLPFNSNKDDFGLTLAKNGNSGFFTSSRTDKTSLTTPFDEIWGFEFQELQFAVSGKVTDSNGELIPSATVRMVGTDGTNARVQTKKDGTYRLLLDKNVDYVMLATARGHLNQNKDLSTQKLTQGKAYNIDFQLGSLFKSVQLDNIFYEFGKWNLTPESEGGLQALVKILRDNPNITIELSAHTDYVGNNQANAELSAKRAQSVVNYLIKAGIEAARLTAVGYGEEKPVVVDATLAKKYPFLKEGVTLTESHILTLQPAQQTAANQINRRTEFRVTSTTYKMY
jgi:peptidoglycan-associated lipoprotein